MEERFGVRERYKTLIVVTLKFMNMSFFSSSCFQAVLLRLSASATGFQSAPVCPVCPKRRERPKKTE
jgi:hypothetical protein